MTSVILAAAVALAGSVALDATANAQVPERSSKPVLTRLAPVFKPPIKTQRPEPLLEALRLSLDTLSASTPRVWRQTPPTRVAVEPDAFGRRWPFRADPRRWPRLFANTTECTLSFDPILRRHWFD